MEFGDLRKAQLQERHSSALVPLSEDFFGQANDYLTALRDSSASGEGAKEFKNAEEVLKSLLELRQQKILWKVLKDLRNNTVSSEGLAREEKQLYTDLIRLLTEFEFKAFPKQEKRETAPPREEKPKSVFLKTRFLTDLPSFAWTDSSSRGPFKKGEMAELEEPLAEFLKQKKAVEIMP